MQYTLSGRESKAIQRMQLANFLQIHANEKIVSPPSKSIFIITPKRVNQDLILQSSPQKKVFYKVIIMNRKFTLKNKMYKTNKRIRNELY